MCGWSLRSMRSRRFGRDESGVSVVVGALLVLSLIIATTVTVRIAYVPVWQADREAAQMRTVQSQFAQFKAVLDRQTEASDLVPETVPLSLGPESTSIWSSNPAPSQVQYDPSVAPLTVYSSKLNLQTQNGTSLLGSD